MFYHLIKKINPYQNWPHAKLTITKKKDNRKPSASLLDKNEAPKHSRKLNIYQKSSWLLIGGAETYTEWLLVRLNHKNELYFSMISFQNEANRVYVSEMLVSKIYCLASLILFVIDLNSNLKNF